MSQRSFLQSQILETDRLLALSGNHPLMTPGLRMRKASLEQELGGLPVNQPEPRATLYFTGAPVFGSIGIDAEFASRVLDPFTRLVKSQYNAARHSALARLPRRDEFESKLFLTALPRGSFGLELTLAGETLPANANIVGGALQTVSDLIRSSAESDDVFAEASSDVASRTLVALRDLLQVIADRQAELRLVTGGNEIRLGTDVMAQALERVRSTVSSVVDVILPGVFRGLILDSWRFDFRIDDGDIISGRLSDEVEEAQAAGFAQFINRNCNATLRRTNVSFRDGRTKTKYELLNIVPVADPIE